MEKLGYNSLISIIIPCFNSGLFLVEAVDSCFSSDFLDFEIIIVNDGSTDLKTLELLNKDWPSNVKVIHQKNNGPAAARNFGVSKAKGDYLFFLDSDNRIKSIYLKKAFKAISNDPSIAVVYSKPNFFGVTKLKIPRFESRSFSFEALLAGNYIDMCSLVRKRAFFEVGGFDESKCLLICEDWDLWIRLANLGFKFHFIDEVLFDYRVREDSLMGNSDISRRKEMLEYLGEKHGFIIHQKYRRYFRVMNEIQQKPFRYFLRILYYKYILRKPLVN